MTTNVIAYSIRGAAEAVGMSPDHIRRQIKAGALKAKRMGTPDSEGNPTGDYRIATNDLLAWFRAHPDA